MSSVLVKCGEYRNRVVENMTFSLVKGLTSGAKGLYVTVKNEGHFEVKIPVVKIKVQSAADVEFSDVEAEPTTVPVVEVETDQQAMDRIAYRFKILEEMAAACIKGNIRGMIVTGPPGVGKSYGVEGELEKASLFDKIAERKIRYEIVKGAITALGLYVKLYKYSDPKNVLVFDDCDSIFMDDLTLNIMKAALDSGKRRKICWNSDSRLLREESIPESFEFKGSAIFITNLKFSNIRSKKLQDHLEALQSRCHFVDLTIDTDRDKMLRIKQVHRDVKGGLFADYDFENDEADQIFKYMEEQSRKLREVSMRMALKIADLMVVSPTAWKTLAESTVMHRKKA